VQHLLVIVRNELTNFNPLLSFIGIIINNIWSFQFNGVIKCIHITFICVGFSLSGYIACQQYFFCLLMEKDQTQHALLGYLVLDVFDILKLVSTYLFY
jgi:hypothetical protein